MRLSDRELAAVLQALRVAPQSELSAEELQQLIERLKSDGGGSADAITGSMFDRAGRIIGTITITAK